MGINLSLATDDLEALLRWAAPRISDLPPETFSRLELTCDKEFVILTAYDLDLNAPMASDSVLHRTLMCALLNGDRTISFSAKRHSGSSILISWQINGLLLSSMQNLGIVSMFLRWCSSGDKFFIEPQSNGSVILHLDRIPALTAVCCQWTLDSFQIPGKNNSAVYLTATPFTSATKP